MTRAQLRAIMVATIVSNQPHLLIPDAIKKAEEIIDAVRAHLK